MNSIFDWGPWSRRDKCGHCPPIPRDFDQWIMEQVISECPLKILGYRPPMTMRFYYGSDFV